MTAQSAAEKSEDASAEPLADNSVDAPEPLSAFVRGILTVHFNGGAVATRDVAQLDARAFLRKQKDSETSDEVTWGTRAWFTWASERVVFSSFDAARDQNWAITPEDRRRLCDTGHPDGVVASLVRFWERRRRRDEPMYSVRAIAGLHQLALDGASRRIWDTAARIFEGQAGAELAADAGRTAKNPTADDDAPVEDAPVEPDDAHAHQPGAATADAAQPDRVTDDPEAAEPGACLDIDDNQDADEELD